MSSELDRFVLQYIVEQREALARLEALNRRVEATAKNAKSAKSELKDFATGAADEVGKLVPGVDKVSTAIKAMSGEFAAAGIAVGVLAVGIKSLMDMREQYNKQRAQSMDIGVSSLRLEEYQRKFVKASGGNITRDQTADEIKKLSQFTSAIYRDPTRIGTEARTARVLGIDVGQPGEKGISVNQLMEQLGDKFSKMTDVQVQAAAKTLGINQDFALGIKKQGPDIGKITELKPEEIANRKVAQTELAAFNEAMAKLTDNFKKAENILGEKLLPPFLRFIEAMADLSEKIPKTVNKYADPTGRALINAATLGFGEALGFIDHEPPPANKPAATPGTKTTPDAKTTASAKGAAKSAEATAKSNAATAKNLKEMVDGDYEVNEEAKRLADQQALSINQFAGAVASFANAVDEKQAWAAWAGEIGKLNGLGPERNETPEKPKSALAPVKAATDYDDIFNAAGKKYGIDPALLKNISKIESSFDKNQVSPQGAKGLMQIMPANFKSLGISDPFNPEQNIMGGANLMSQFMKRAGGDVRKALTFYHGGFDTSGWGPRTRAYPDKVLNAGASIGMADKAVQPKGETRDNLGLRRVQNTIAGRLGVPVNQLQLGGVNQGDVKFASFQLESGIRNHIFDIQNQLKAVNLPQQTRSKMMTELREQQSGLMQLRKYSGGVIEAAQPGERSITIGERAIIINVNGSDDPKATAATIQAHLNDHLGEMVNGTATGMKY